MKNQGQPKLTVLSTQWPAEERRGYEKPELLIDVADYPRTARQIRDLLASERCIVERGTPVKVVKAEEDPPKLIPLTPDQIILEVHRLCQPVKVAKDGSRVPTTLTNRVARLYLAMSSEWNLPPLAGISTAPVLASDGSIRAVDGYDARTRLWCANVPPLQIPDVPNRTDAEAALHRLRQTFQSFPFADSIRRSDPRLGFDVVDLEHAPGQDESALLVGLMTAVCRPSLPLAPGLVIRAPEISGSGTGKGLLAAAISVIAFGVIAKVFTAGHDGHELDKRLAAALIHAEQVVCLDNKNSSILRSDTMASALTERAMRIRKLGSSQMVSLNTTAFFVVTGNGLCIAEDLARRFLDSKLDAGCENPEQRQFKEGFLESIKENRAALLTDILTIWRWGRLNPVKSGLPIGGFEQWADWCRSPFVALGCCDPVRRIEAIKSEDPARRNIAELFACWDAHHDDSLLQAADLADPVRALIDPRRRDHRVAGRLTALAGTRAGGFVLTQHIDPSCGVSTYRLKRTTANGEEGDGGCADASKMSAATSTRVQAVPLVDGPQMFEERAHDEATDLGREPLGESRITIELERGQYVHVNRDFDAVALARVLDVLARAR